MVNQQNAMPPVAHCSKNMAASRRITPAEGNGEHLAARGLRCQDPQMTNDPAPAVAARFRELHVPGTPLFMPNAWDIGSARTLVALGAQAIATTSSGFALTRGRRDYQVTRAEAIAHGAELAAAVDVPVSADLENGFGTTPDDAAATIRSAADAGLAGGSIEDASGDPSAPILEVDLAVERIAAAANAARASGTGFVLTARAESFLWEREPDLGAVIERLQRFAAAGADVLFAPGLPDLAAVRLVCDAVDRPVNVLLVRGLDRHTLAEHGAAGAARLSTGGALAFLAYGAMAEAVQPAFAEGRFDGWGGHADGTRAVRAALR